MSSTRFEPEGSSSGRRLCIQVWYSVFYRHQHKQSCRQSSLVSRRVCSYAVFYLQNSLYWRM